MRAGARSPSSSEASLQVTIAASEQGRPQGRRLAGPPVADDAAQWIRARLASGTLALCVAAGGSLAGGAAGGAPPLAGPWDMIAFDVRSWGRPLTSWRLLPGGSGSWTESVEERGERGPRFGAVWHEVEAGPQGFGRLAAELARLPMPAPDSAACSNFIPDLPYGTLRLTRGATTIEIAWNSGCMDADYRAFVAVLKAADSMVAGWGRAGRVLRTEPLALPR